MKAILACVTLALSFLLAPLTAQAETRYTKQAVERWIVSETKSDSTSPVIQRIVNAVFAQAKKQSIDPLLILSTIKQESRFKVHASSPYGAKGLMQVVPRWHRDKIAGRNILNIETNIEVGTQVLVDCLDKNKGIVSKALGCYSGGAKKYEARLRDNYKAIKQADVLYRFSNSLPVHTHTKFEDTSYSFAETESSADKAVNYALNQ